MKKIKVIYWERLGKPQPARKKDKNADFLCECARPATQIENDKRGTQREKPL